MNWIESTWQGRQLSTLLLLPLSGLFCLVSLFRRWFYRLGLLSRHKVGIPVIIVGNITVGGTGKTPLIVWMAQQLIEWGYRPGIITRGYGGQSKHWPCEVRSDSRAEQVGDEAILLMRHSGCPVYAGPDRPIAAEQLISNHQCDLILSDDGLQHYALDRDLEIVVVDGQRRFGNGYCLPAGPLRETPKRLSKVDFVIVNGDARPGEYQMSVSGSMAIALNGELAPKTLVEFSDSRVDAIAGIGNPERFFSMLEASGLRIDRHPFPDHHLFSADELTAYSGNTVLMTEKDAVKCEEYAQSNHWYVPAIAKVDPEFEKLFMTKVKRLLDG
ncbi:MAG: tetraacyldisaccharide 4'-kinase [Candidatus Thiodiazotropha sp. L084R]